MKRKTGTVSLSRRTALKTLAALGVLSTMPALAKDCCKAVPQDGLLPYARQVGVDPRAAAAGRAAAGGRDAFALETTLRSRLPGLRDVAEWKRDLLAAGREDVTRGDMVEVAGRRLMRMEADFLALAAVLQDSAMA